VADKRLYGAVRYDRHGHRAVVGVSHNTKVLRRRFPDLRIFHVENLVEKHGYAIVGKEIAV
jgi:hypothetical protein